MMKKRLDCNLTCDNICDDAGELCVAGDELPEHADNLVSLDLNKHELLVRNRAINAEPHLVPHSLPYQLVDVSRYVSCVRIVYELCATIIHETSEDFDTKCNKKVRRQSSSPGHWSLIIITNHHLISMSLCDTNDGKRITRRKLTILLCRSCPSS